MATLFLLLSVVTVALPPPFRLRRAIGYFFILCSVLQAFAPLKKLQVNVAIMGRKRKMEEKEKIKRKIRKLEEKLKKPSRRRLIISSSSSSSSEDESSCSHVSCALEGEERAVTPQPSSPPSPPPEAVLEAPPEPISMTREASDDLILGDDILNLLGEAPKIKTSLGKNIHNEIASRWQELLCNGLSKDVKDKICQEYLVPVNCDLLVAPSLNPETKAALTDFIVKRDASLQQKQQQLGTALAALSQATDLLISKESPEKVLKPLSDACRLLCDSHYLDTKTRRNFVISAVKPELKDTLVNTTRNQLLFGENLNEQIKSAKNIQKTGEGLKVTQKQPIFDKNRFNKTNKNQQKNNLNYKGSYRKAVPPGRPDLDRPQQAQRPMRNRPQQNQPRARERSPPRRACRK